jgi:hypothetical protein
VAGIPARIALVPLGLLLAPCANPLDLCPPEEARAAFFARGDCIVTDGPVFGAHRWITELANEDLPESDRFTEPELDLVIDGNRRQDWPKELLVHLNTGFVAYFDALVQHTNAPENQADHFLLADRDTPADVAAEAGSRFRRWTREAVEAWTSDPPGALTRVGKACHMLQDSYSTAHTRRDPTSGCIVTVKAYIRRAPGFLTEDIEFHGGEAGSMVGHSTPEDSLFHGTEECRNPRTREEIEACIQDSATEARRATADYFALLRELLARDAWDETSEATLDSFIARRLSLCPSE